ncbi:MAG TPA: response regulator transcription factor [Anaerolineales bacterium]
MKAKILVVDDEEMVRSSLEEILRLEGYDVKTALDGEDALLFLQSEGFDLVLLDLKMPGMDGMDVLRAAGRVAPEAKVILLTGHGSLESAIEALRHGAQDYILKPAPSHDILNSVANALARKSEQQQRRFLVEQLDASVQRLKNVEGLGNSPSANQQSISLDGGVMIDLTRREIWRGNQRISLTPTEGKLMKVLVENRGRVLTHRDLVLLVQGYETSDWEAPEVLRPLISRLRRKLSAFPGGENWISNVRGTGYVFEWQEGFDEPGKGI